MSYVRDTIVARATAPGRSGIGIVRVSGPAAPDIARRLTGSVPKPRYATFSHFRDSDGQAIDHGIVLYFPGPDSFTGEDVLELQGHGSPVAMDMLVSEIVAHDTTGEVRLARPGEFSERAFLNEKMDLAQAEAVADLIDSSTREAARGAMRTLEGEFSHRINELQAGVTELRVYVEAAIDFPDEEVDFLSDHRVTEMLDLLLEQLADLASEAQTGSLLTEGASVVLLGRPNAGKSSLMNRLTGRDTSIVTAIAGTTRDRVDEHLQLDGIPLRLVDTAGIRTSDDEIEAEGVRRALAAAATADLVIVMIDASSLDADDKALEELRATLPAEANPLVVFNKVDLPGARVPRGGIGLSALTGQGMDVLKNRLKALLGVSGPLETGFTARRRHLVALGQARDHLAEGRRQLQSMQAGELLAEELRQCQRALSEITGEFTADDLLGEIFGSFCIGK